MSIFNRKQQIVCFFRMYKKIEKVIEKDSEMECEWLNSFKICKPSGNFFDVFQKISNKWL